MSKDDEKQIDEVAARQVADQIGLVDDPELTEYVDALGQALAAHSPRQDVRYRFHVVAMDEPNAFALPGGHIYVSRGLLTLLNDEAELANVLGHEIGHVAARHAAQRDAMVKLMTVLNTVGMIGVAAGGARSNGNGGPVGNPGLHGFSRDQESEADEIGQNLAVATGIDPAGMARLLRSLDGSERLRQGFSRETGYFDTHPAARERAAEAATAAEVRRFDGDFRIAASQSDFLERMSGLSVGPPAAEGVVEDGRFVHPNLGIGLRFPQGWEVENTHTAVYAVSPGRDAAVMLELQAEGDDPAAAAHDWAGDAARGRDAGPISIGDLEGFRVRDALPTAAGRTQAEVTWISHGGHIYRLSGFVLRGDFSRFAGVFRAFPRSFHTLTDAERESVTELRLQVAEAEPGETLEALSARTGNAWGVVETAVQNSIRPGQALEAGQLVKVAVEVPYRPDTVRPDGEIDREPDATAGEAVSGPTWRPRPLPAADATERPAPHGRARLLFRPRGIQVELVPPSRRAGRPAASEWIEPDQFEPHWIQPKEPRLPVVIVPEAYRGPTQGVARIDVDADTVRAALESVERAHPGFFDLIVDGSGRQHRFVKLFINEEQLAADALDTPLGSDDRLEVLAAIAGG